jgi:hypothetical protein
MKKKKKKTTTRALLMKRKRSTKSRKRPRALLKMWRVGMNMEGDPNATPLAALPPPPLQTKMDGPKADTAAAVLNYTDILKSMDAESKRAAEPAAPPPQPPLPPPQEYVYMQPPAPVNYVYTQPPVESIMIKYKNFLFVSGLFFVMLYYVRPRLRTMAPALFTESGRMTVAGMAAISALAGASFEVGDKFIISKLE